VTGDLLALFKTAVDYDPETGLFRWKLLSGKARPGAIAGSRHCQGYVAIGYQGHRMLAHRLAWAFVHGEFPRHEIDHINGDRTDNRIANLRDVSRSVNNENLRGARSHNKSGLLGVSRRNWCSTFGAAIRVNGKRYHLGSFPSAEKAHEAYLTAKRRLHEGNTL
jgi:hypothetical protein